MKTKILAISIGASCLFMMTGCATLFGGGGHQNITINSSKQKNMTLHYIDDENVTSDAVQSFQAPATINVKRKNKDIVLKDADGVCGDVRMKRSTNNWFIGDIIATSPLSTTVDMISGATWEYDNNATLDCAE